MPSETVTEVPLTEALVEAIAPEWVRIWRDASDHGDDVMEAIFRCALLWRILEHESKELVRARLVS